jgi:pyruvate,water dikinase
MPSQIDFEIMVTSHTDPGWTSLIALSKGLIIEHGGVLSHASIVARELGIPAVIGAENAVDILSDGQMVEIDGSAGTIRIL